MSIQIVVDSSAGIPATVASTYGINVIPVTIQRGSRTFRDVVDLDYHSFYDMLSEEPLLKTSQPSPGAFIELYSELASRGQSIVSIHVTALASGTYQAAMLAKENLPDVDIEVVDSGTTSMALGFVAMAAAAAVRLGKSKDEVLQAVDDAKSRVDVFMAIPALQQLRKSGKIGVGQALIGSLLAVKPVLTMRGGMLEVCDRVRTYPRAVERVVELVSQAAGRGRVKLAILYSKTRDEAVRLSDVLGRRLQVTDLILTEIGAALAVHGGPGMLGAAIFREN